MGGIPLTRRSLAFRWSSSQTHLPLFGGFGGTYIEEIPAVARAVFVYAKDGTVGIYHCSTVV